MDKAELEKLKGLSKEEIKEVTGGANQNPSLACQVCGECFEGFLALREHYKAEHPDVWAEWNQN